MTKSDFDRAYLMGVRDAHAVMCAHLPLESLQDAGWKNFVDVQLMIKAKEEFERESRNEQS